MQRELRMHIISVNDVPGCNISTGLLAEIVRPPFFNGRLR